MGAPFHVCVAPSHTCSAPLLGRACAFCCDQSRWGGHA
jgi:hypothetical protein